MSPAELREALDALGGGGGGDGGSAATTTPRFSMSEMHDASEVLGEIFTCLHRCGSMHAFAIGIQSTIHVCSTVPHMWCAPMCSNARALHWSSR